MSRLALSYSSQIWHAFSCIVILLPVLDSRHFSFAGFNFSALDVAARLGGSNPRLKLRQLLLVGPSVRLHHMLLLRQLLSGYASFSVVLHLHTTKTTGPVFAYPCAYCLAFEGDQRRPIKSGIFLQKHTRTRMWQVGFFLALRLEQQLKDFKDLY